MNTKILMVNGCATVLLVQRAHVSSRSTVDWYDCGHRTMPISHIHYNISRSDLACVIIIILSHDITLVLN